MTPKTGDRFKLGAWVWKVLYLYNRHFSAVKDDYCTITLSLEDADSLEWIKEPATISQEARDEIVEYIEKVIGFESTSDQNMLIDFLDSMVTKEQ